MLVRIIRGVDVAVLALDALAALGALDALDALAALGALDALDALAITVMLSVYSTVVSIFDFPPLDIME